MCDAEMASENVLSQSFAMNKPVYIKNFEIQMDKNNKICDFEKYESIHKKVGDEVLCIQLERDLWRVYLKSKKSRSVLIVEGFEIRNITAQVYESNPYSTGATSPRDNICGLHLSVDESAVLEMLHFLISRSRMTFNMKTSDIQRMTKEQIHLHSPPPGHSQGVQHLQS